MPKEGTPTVSKPRAMLVPPREMLLTHEQIVFVDTYATNGYNADAAAETMGLKRGRGASLMGKPTVQAAIEWRRQHIATDNADMLDLVLQELEAGMRMVLTKDDKAHLWAYKFHCMHDMMQHVGGLTLQVDINATITSDQRLQAEVLVVQQTYSHEELRTLLAATRPQLMAPKAGGVIANGGG